MKQVKARCLRQGELSVEILRDVIACVEENLQKTGGELPPAKKAELIALVYEDTIESEAKVVDLKAIRKLISLAT